MEGHWLSMVHATPAPFVGTHWFEVQVLPVAHWLSLEQLVSQVVEPQA